MSMGQENDARVGLLSLCLVARFSCGHQVISSPIAEQDSESDHGLAVLVDFMTMIREDPLRCPVCRTSYGTCRVCGCTDGRACPGGCSWVDETHTLCSACVPVIK